MEIQNLKSIGKNSNPYAVSDLKPSMRDENRVNVYIGGVFACSLDIAQVIDYGVKVGKIFTEEQIEDLKSASEFGKLYQSTLEWILARPRSIRETRDHLKNRKIKRASDNRRREQAKVYKSDHKDENPYKNPDNLDENGRLKFKNSVWAIRTDAIPEISDENIERVISRLIEKGFLDDEKFAKYYVENRNVRKGISEKKLISELMQKGISKNLIDLALSTSPRSVSAEINKIITKKKSRYSRDKMFSYLLRQGFPYDAINSALDEVYQEQ